MKRIISFLVPFLFNIAACGNSDNRASLPDETGGVVYLEAVVTPFYLGANESVEVDVVQNPDCDGETTTVDPEPYGPHEATLEIARTTLLMAPPVDTPLIIDDYAVEFFDVDSELTLVESFGRTLAMEIGVDDGIYVFPIEFLELDLKALYRAAWETHGPSSGNLFLSSKATYVFTGHATTGEPFKLRADVVFQIGDYDNCAAENSGG